MKTTLKKEILILEIKNNIPVVKRITYKDYLKKLLRKDTYENN